MPVLVLYRVDFGGVFQFSVSSLCTLFIVVDCTGSCSKEGAAEQRLAILCAAHGMTNQRACGVASSIFRFQSPATLPTAARLCGDTMQTCIIGLTVFALDKEEKATNERSLSSTLWFDAHGFVIIPDERSLANINKLKGA
jgi:hypothetical protein